MQKIVLLACILFTFTIAKAQLPETKVYLLDLQKNGAKIIVSNPKMVSNKKGYNNQPYFMDDDRNILFVSNNGNGNTDIYRYDMKKKSIKRITKTDEAEYSPRQSMAEDNEITCVRVEKDTVTQHFYAYNNKGKKGHLLLPDLSTIGYYTWLNGAEIVAFTLPEPFTLVKYNVVTLKADTIIESIGRTIINNRSKIYYVDKSDSEHYYIKQIAKENIRPRKGKEKVADITVLETLPEQEDFCILNDGTILMGDAGKLYAFNPKKVRGKVQEDWIEVADLNKMGIGIFYRLVVNADNTKMAVVGYEGKKP